jgi:hypothetical protein
LSVQCLYQNAFLLLAALVGGGAVCAQRRDWWTALRLLAIGGVAAASLLPYVPLVRESQAWWDLLRGGFNLGRLWQTLSVALGQPWHWLAWLAGLVTIGYAVWRGWRRPPASPARERALGLYGATCAFAALATFGLFLGLARLPTQVWYWIPLLYLVAGAIECAWPARDIGRRTRLAAMLGLVALSLPGVWTSLRIPMSNAREVAAVVQKVIAPKDLVVVYPWFLGVSFARYETGGFAWTTVPPLADHRFHRSDLFRAAMAQTRPIAETLERIRQTLADGHTVWLVGTLPLAEAGGPPLADLPPAPTAGLGWNEEYYSNVWGIQLVQAVLAQAAQFEPVPVPTPYSFRPMESFTVHRASGLRPVP